MIDLSFLQDEASTRALVARPFEFHWSGAKNKFFLLGEAQDEAKSDQGLGS